MHRYYVVPFDDDWAVTREAARRPRAVYASRGAAIVAAEEVARAERAAVFVQDRDGRGCHMWRSGGKGACPS